MVIPEDVDRNRITSHRLGHLYAVQPILRGYAGRVHLPADDLKGLAIQQEVIIAQREAVFLLCSGDRRNE